MASQSAGEAVTAHLNRALGVTESDVLTRYFGEPDQGVLLWTNR